MDIVNLDSRRPMASRRETTAMRVERTRREALATGRPAAELGITDAQANREHARLLRRLADDCSLAGPMLREFATREEINADRLDELDARR